MGRERAVSDFMKRHYRHFNAAVVVDAAEAYVRLIDGGGERIYGTQGDDRCQLDEVDQQPLGAEGQPARSYRIAGRGFCIAPARALDGEGAVLLTRFDFAGVVTLEAEQEAITGVPAT